MLSNYRPTIENLISFSANGLHIASFSDIKIALINRYKDIYGSDIDVDDSTADGIFINNLALAINNIFLVVNSLYDNLDINNASGPYLDMLCALSNVIRKRAISTKITVLLTNATMSAGSYTKEQLTIVDNDGIEWNTNQDITFTSDTPSVSIEYECSVPGPITTPSTWTAAFIAPEVLMYVSQPVNIKVGSAEEDDYALRTRQMQYGSGSGVSVITGLESALLSLHGILDVKVYNNVDSSGFDVTEYDDGDSSLETTMPPKSIYVVVRKDNTVKIDEEAIGSTIYNKLTPGIKTTEPNVDEEYVSHYQYKNTINGIAVSKLDTQDIYWKVADYIKPIRFTITVNSNFNTSEKEQIASNLMNYLNKLPIAYIPTVDELKLRCIAADPRNAGIATYTCTDVKFLAANGEDYLSELPYKNSVFNYNSSVLAKVSDTVYTLTLIISGGN